MPVPVAWSGGGHRVTVQRGQGLQETPQEVPTPSHPQPRPAMTWAFWGLGASSVTGGALAEPRSQTAPSSIAAHLCHQAGGPGEGQQRARQLEVPPLLL